MRVCKFVQVVIASLAVSTMAGCADIPTKYMKDTTPYWLKYEVTGSRIRRPTGVDGQPASGSFVTRASPRGLALMLGVSIYGM